MAKTGFDLAAVLGNVPNLDTDGAREQIEYIDIDQIDDDPKNFYELSGLDELAANIELIGLQQPLRVRSGESGRVTIISGHRRRAAIRKLVDDGRDDLRRIPCIREADTVSPAMAELRLIYANSDTRTMTSAELGKQAERVEALLYELKEQGVEFPGRMRDHVAEACKLSKSKLARLKVIRDKLISDWYAHYASGELAESTAYTIAQMPVGHQTALYDGVARKGRQLKYFYESEAGRYGKKMAYTDGLQCPKQANSPCTNTASKLNRICHRADDYMQTTPCAKCCADCEYLISCGYACALCNAEKSAAKAAQKQAKQKEQDDAARREAEAAERDRDVLDRMKRLETVYDRLQKDLGFLDFEYAEAAGIAHYYIERGSKISRFSRTLLGISGDDIDHICRAADFLGVSVDYLLGRTERPEEVKTAGSEAPSEWPPLEFADGTMESPPKSGPYYCEFCCEGVPLLDTAWWDNELKTWRFSPNGVTIDAECYGWYPLPEDARDAEEEDEHGQE